MAGERFAVRNSGVKGVVEGVGDHGCEYMTGGAIAVIGDVGKNFAAGMSGGVAYVWDPEDTFAEKANTGMVSLSENLEPKDRRMLRRLLENHAGYTGSERAEMLLSEWDERVHEFVRVLPDAYAEIIAERESDDVRTELPEPAAPDAGTDAADADFQASTDD
jgi:glutamate synthase (NADPH/NADH) large chain